MVWRWSGVSGAHDEGEKERKRFGLCCATSEGESSGDWLFDDERHTLEDDKTMRAKVKITLWGIEGEREAHNWWRLFFIAP